MRRYKVHNAKDKRQVHKYKRCIVQMKKKVHELCCIVAVAVGIMVVYINETGKPCPDKTLCYKRRKDLSQRETVYI